MKRRTAHRSTISNMDKGVVYLPWITKPLKQTMRAEPNYRWFHKLSNAIKDVYETDDLVAVYKYQVGEVYCYKIWEK